MNHSVQEQVIIMSLQPLFEQAEGEGLWFFHESDDTGEVWASPGFLHDEHNEGRLIWAPEHWELRSPIDYMASLHRKASELITEYNEMAERLIMPQVHLTEEQDMSPDARIGSNARPN